MLSACEGIGCEWMPEELRRADVSPGVRAALYLLRHSALGPAHSPWAAYFASLPEDIDTVESWSAAELDALRGTAAHDDLARISDPATGAIVGAAFWGWAGEGRKASGSGAGGGGRGGRTSGRQAVTTIAPGAASPVNSSRVFAHLLAQSLKS